MDKHTEKIIENEREWRRYVVLKLDKLDAKINSVEIKVAGLGSFFGFIGAYIKAKFFGGS